MEMLKLPLVFFRANGPFISDDPADKISSQVKLLSLQKKSSVPDCCCGRSHVTVAPAAVRTLSGSFRLQSVIE